MRFETFVELVRSSTRKPKLILFFACLTGEFARLFDQETDPWIIGWSSVVQDDFAQTFSNAVLRRLGALLPNLAREGASPIDVRQIVEQLYAAGKNDLDAAAIGDPAVELGQYEEHLQIFCNEVKNRVALNPELQRLSSWKMQNIANPEGRWLDFRRILPNCPHCKPKKMGVPFLHHASQ